MEIIQAYLCYIFFPVLRVSFFMTFRLFFWDFHNPDPDCIIIHKYRDTEHRIIQAYLCYIFFPVLKDVFLSGIFGTYQ